MFHVERGFRGTVAFLITVGKDPVDLKDLLDNHNYGSLIYNYMYDSKGRPAFFPETAKPVNLKETLKDWLTLEPKEIKELVKSMVFQ